MTDADTNLSNLTTLWLLLGAYMVFLMQVSDDFLFISYHPSFFFRTNWRRLGDIKKVLRNERIEASFFDCLFGLPQNAQLFFLSDG